MRKTITTLFVLILVMSLGISAFAASASATGTVTFNGTKLNTSFSAAELNTLASSLQPGDDLTYTITLRNDHTAETDWWMKNEVLHSFEQTNKTNGGAYSYYLEYKGPNSSRTIYDSDSVGGETGDYRGLTEATSALKDYFILGSLKKGDTATVTLKVKLDGETQRNNYWDSLADLNMRFAVELTKTPNKDVVKTGDETDILPYVVAAMISGTVLLVIAILRLGKVHEDRRKRRRES